MHLLYAAGGKDGWVTENSGDDNELLNIKSNFWKKLFFKNECALSGPWTDMCLNSRSFTQAKQTILATKKYLNNASMEDIFF